MEALIIKLEKKGYLLTLLNNETKIIIKYPPEKQSLYKTYGFFCTFKTTRLTWFQN